MPKYRCRYGNVLDLVECPAPCEYLLVSEKQIEAAGEYVESDALDREGLFAILDKESRTVYECPNCGRLHIRKSLGAPHFEVFRREDEGVGSSE